MSESTEGNISDTGSVLSGVVSGVGDVVHNVTYGMGDAMHNVTSGVRRLLTMPPDGEAEEEEECPGVLPPTPRNTWSPDSDFHCSDRSPGTDSEMAEEDAAINEELGITEDHFSAPEVQSVAGLERSIEKCKSLILQCEEASTRRRALVHKLIQMRLRLQEMLEVDEITSRGVVMIMGHQLQPQKLPITRASKKYCDTCAQALWGVVNGLYVCILCEYLCHPKCKDRIRRKCANLKASEDPNYILRICPEVGLSVQNYKCAECRRSITNNDPWREPRRCDYTGLYYCPLCHWNSRLIVPARVIHNWDFEERVVSRQAKQFLQLMKNRPVLHLEKLNPFLFRFSDELNTVKKIREDLLKMKQYLSSCRNAQESRMLRQLEGRQHFVENAHMYSLQDVIDVNSGVLADYLDKIYLQYLTHIKEDCAVCQGKGFICEICDSSEIIFPFDGGVVLCDGCCTVLHQHCYTSRNNACPRCLRQEARRKQELDKSD